VAFIVVLTDLQKAGHDREIVNQATMKLCLGCYNPFSPSIQFLLCNREPIFTSSI